MGLRGRGFIKLLRRLQADRQGCGEGASAVLEGESGRGVDRRLNKSSLFIAKCLHGSVLLFETNCKLQKVIKQLQKCSPLQLPAATLIAAAQTTCTFAIECSPGQNTCGRREDGPRLIFFATAALQRRLGLKNSIAHTLPLPAESSSSSSSCRLSPMTRHAG